MLKAHAFVRSFFAVSLIVILAVSAFADTIRLKDGSIIKGKITGFSGGKFVVVIGEGPRRREMIFSAADVESVDFDRESTIDPGVDVQQKPVSMNNGQTTNSRVVVSDTTTETKKPEPVAVKTPAPVTTRPTTKISNAKPIEVSVKVMADNSANGWTNSGWVVRKGQRIKISGSGEVSLGGGKTTSASGLYDLDDQTKLLKGVPTGALIAVVGDDNNDFIYIGSEREFTATRDGALFLGINEGNLNDNTGSFQVKVEIAPDGE
jgi:hypothetical protein